MPKLTPQEAREKHARRLKGSLEDVRRGVTAVTKAPTQAAKAKKDKYRQRLMEALESGKWEAGLDRVDLASWQASTIEKGLPRISQGIDGAAEKVEGFYAQLFPHIEAGQREIEKMSDVTIEDSIARSTAFIRHMSKFRRK